MPCSLYTVRFQELFRGNDDSWNVNYIHFTCICARTLLNHDNGESLYKKYADIT